MIEDKRYRKQLTDRYLTADTTVEEEILLAEYYATHPADEDEADIARLILADSTCASVLTDAGVREFDAACIGSKRIGEQRSLLRAIRLTAVSVAACLAVVILLFRHSAGCGFTTMEIAENMNMVMELNMQNVESIVAKPHDSRVVLTAVMKDGSSSTFIMTRNRKDGSTRILARK